MLAWKSLTAPFGSTHSEPPRRRHLGPLRSLVAAFGSFPKDSAAQSHPFGSKAATEPPGHPEPFWALPPRRRRWSDPLGSIGCAPAPQAPPDRRPPSCSSRSTPLHRLRYSATRTSNRNTPRRTPAFRSNAAAQQIPPSKHRTTSLPSASGTPLPRQPSGASPLRPLEVARLAPASGPLQHAATPRASFAQPPRAAATPSPSSGAPRPELPSPPRLLWPPPGPLRASSAAAQAHFTSRASGRPKPSEVSGAAPITAQYSSSGGRRAPEAAPHSNTTAFGPPGDPLGIKSPRAGHPANHLQSTVETPPPLDQPATSTVGSAMNRPNSLRAAQRRPRTTSRPPPPRSLEAAATIGGFLTFGQVRGLQASGH